MRILGAFMIAAALASAAEVRLRVDSVPDSKIVHRVQPAYPPDARDARIEGVVRVRVFVGKDGRVEDARIVSGHPLLSPAALHAAKQWTFKPFEHEGKPSRAVTELEFPFRLASSQ